MSHYARDLAQQLLEAVEQSRDDDAHPLREALFEALSTVNPNDFRQEARATFARLKTRMKEHVRMMTMQDEYMDPDLLRQLIATFDESYGRAEPAMRSEARPATRSLTFVQNGELRQIVERDYRELDAMLVPVKAWKSVVVMAGSILEAVLYDQLTTDPATVSKAMAAQTAPKKKGGVRDILNDSFEDEWRLNDLIKVAAELGIIRPEDERPIHAVLREYRNFVHPRAEIKGQFEITEAEGMMAKSMLDMVLNRISK